MNVEDSIWLNDAGKEIKISINFDDAEDSRISFSFPADEAWMTEADLSQMVRFINKMKRIHKSRMIP